MLEVGLIVGIAALLGGAYYLRRTQPWPFEYEGRKYRRMPDGSFQDANKQIVVDVALVPHLRKAYESAKYGEKDMSDWPDAD
ncbi:hypothetical protein [Devosia salina]|uniref:Uncharacterized protein n=1 Tax=Devosia salina TaxID=2860336 RepID=A0ABX8WF26_9HYPH|nr:hypothetical protein [Devosia salina]QYO76067.1 hypothetical protein K1X15_15800 [Devosia salina]